MSTILTLAIPAYNMEKYLDRCLKTVLFPELAGEVEVLLINDGSKDATLEIARRYEAKYPQLLRVIDKPNGGWGSAINIAIKEAKGIYFRILDSDDWFDSDAYKEYIQLLKSVDVDVLATSHRYVYTDGGCRDVIYSQDICDKVISFDSYLIDNQYQPHINLSCMTIKVALFREHNLVIADKYYADLDYVNSALAFVKTIRFSTINLYRYYIGREGQSTSIAGYSAHFDDYMKVVLKQADFYEIHKGTLSGMTLKMYQFDIPKLLIFAYYILMSPLYNGNKSHSKKQLKDFDRKLKSISPELYKLVGKSGKRKGIRYISIWRTFNFNLLKLR